MNRSIVRRVCGCALLVLGLASPGCYLPGGNGFSNDTHTFQSTSWNPVTVSLKDTRTGQDIWSVDVPVGKQLVMHFRDGDGVEGSGMPDVMEWEIMDNGEMFGQLNNTIPVPPASNR